MNTPSTAAHHHLWLGPFLARHGFHPDGANAYTNGRARFEIRGQVLIAHPGDGGRPWQTRLDAGEPPALGEALALLLKSPGFQSFAELVRTTARRQQAEAALHYLGTEISEAPESHAGVHLRRLLWSLYNGHHFVGLWQLKVHLSVRQQAAATLLFGAWMQGHVPEDALRQTLTDSGEMDRWDQIHLTHPQHEHLNAALDAVTDLLNALPPGRPTPELTRAYGLLKQATDSLRTAARS